MSQTIAITGGAGFIGLALAEAFCARGDQVHLLDLAPPDPALMARPELRGTRFSRCDILQSDALRDLLRDSAPDLVIHAAAITPNADTTAQYPARIARVNVDGAVQVLHAAAGAGVGDVILLSSVSVYGSRGTGAPELLETAAVTPDTLYGETKLAAERLCATIAPLLGVRLATVRLGAVFGPWECLRDARPDVSPQAAVRRLSATGHPARLLHEMRIDWVYSRDAAAMIAGVAARMDTAAGGCFNIGGGHAFALTDWAEAMGLPRPVIVADAPDIAPRAHADRAPMSVAAITALTGIAGSRSMADAVADERHWRAPLQESPQ